MRWNQMKPQEMASPLSGLVNDTWKRVLEKFGLYSRDQMRNSGGLVGRRMYVTVIPILPRRDSTLKALYPVAVNPVCTTGNVWESWSCGFFFPFWAH
jgi:hypothetical protein